MKRLFSSVQISKRKDNNIMRFGVNINPELPERSNYPQPGSSVAKSTNVVRWVFKASQEKRSVSESLLHYEPLMEKFLLDKTFSVIVINQQTLWDESAGWQDGGNWAIYIQRLASVTTEIVRAWGNKYEFAIQVWNEPDINGMSSIAIQSDVYARMLRTVGKQVKQTNKRVQVFTAGFANGVGHVVEYIKPLLRADTIDTWDALCIHPYGQKVENVDFDTSWFGNLKDYLRILKQNIPQNVQLWCTELGFAHHPYPQSVFPKIAQYMQETYSIFKNENFSGYIWFAWSDGMELAGVVDNNGNPKQPIYDTYVSLTEKSNPISPLPQTSKTYVTPKNSVVNIRNLPSVTSGAIVDRLQVGAKAQTVDSEESVRFRLSQKEKDNYWVEIFWNNRRAWVAAWLLDISK